MNHKAGITNGGISEAKPLISEPEIVEAERVARENVQILERNGLKVNKELLEEKIAKYIEVESVIGMKELVRRTALCRTASEQIQRAKQQKLVSNEALHKLRNQLQTAIDRYQLFPPDFHFGPEAERMITGISGMIDRLSKKEN